MVLEELMPRGITTIITGLIGAAALSSAAVAGGFSRGTADTDILYADGDVVFRSGLLYVAPQRGYETITQSPIAGGATATATDPNYSDSYIVPTMAGKIAVTDDLSCAGTYTQSFGADASYGPQAIAAGLADGTGLVSRHFSTNEIGATCGYKFDGVGPGRFWIIGGVFGEDITYEETVQFFGAPIQAALTPVVGAGTAAAIAGTLDGTTGTLSFDGDYKLGYRFGVAYEIPEIAMRAQLLYRSAITHTPDGVFVTAADFLAGGSGPAVGRGTMPQSVELKVQSGIAPGTLLFGSVKWTDWSVFQVFNYTITGGPLPGVRDLEFFYRDGWTVSAGVGRQITDMVSGSVSLTWDQGVSTTEDAFTDTWTLASGVSVKKDNMEVGLGGAVSYLTSGAVMAETPAPTGGPGNTFGYTVGNDWSFALGGNLKITF
jgi:long-chain fatty acid transport protein